MKALLLFCISVLGFQAQALMVDADSHCAITNHVAHPVALPPTGAATSQLRLNESRSTSNAGGTRPVITDHRITCAVFNGDTAITGNNSSTVIPLPGAGGGFALQRLPGVLAACRITRTPANGPTTSFIIRGATQHRCFRTTWQTAIGDGNFNSRLYSNFRATLSTMIERSSIDMATAVGPAGEGNFQIQGVPAEQ